MSIEQLFFLALFLLIPLLNFLGGLLKRRMEGRAEPAPEREPERAMVTLPAPVPPAPVPELISRPAPRERAAPARLALAPAPRRRRARLRPADVRRGIVMMTILGPCPGLARGPVPADTTALAER